MKSSPTAAITAAKIMPAPESAAPSIALESGFRKAWTRFWFSAVDAVSLHRVRFLTGVLLVAWLLPLGGHLEAFFGMSGWFDRQAYIEASRLANQPLSDMPPVPMWSILYWIGDSAAMLRTIYWLAIAVFALFGLGICTRITSVLTWVFVVSFLASPAAGYDAEYLLGLLALYLMIGYVFLGLWNRPQTPASRVLGWTSPWISRLLGSTAADDEAPSYAANLAVRLLQVHFAIVVVSSALHKLQMGDWWRGMALWFPLHNPFEMTPEILQNEQTSITAHLFILSLVQYLVLAWQLAFPFFAWRPGRWRFVLLGGSVLGWLGSFFVFKQPLFGPVYVIGCLCYLTAAEWHGISDRLAAFMPALGGQGQKAGAKR